VRFGQLLPCIERTSCHCSPVTCLSSSCFGFSDFLFLQFLIHLSKIQFNGLVCHPEEAFPTANVRIAICWQTVVALDDLAWDHNTFALGCQVLFALRSPCGRCSVILAASKGAIRRTNFYKRNGFSLGSFGRTSTKWGVVNWAGATGRQQQSMNHVTPTLL